MGWTEELEGRPGRASLSAAAAAGAAPRAPGDAPHAAAQPVPVRAPAEACSVATGRPALPSLVEPFAVTGTRGRPAPSSRSAASMCLRRGPAGVPGPGSLQRWPGVGSALSSGHQLGLGQPPSAVLPHYLGLRLRDAGVLGQEGLGGGWLLVLAELSLCLSVYGVFPVSGCSGPWMEHGDPFSKVLFSTD